MSACLYYNPYLVRVQRQRLRPRLDPLGVVPGHLLAARPRPNEPSPRGEGLVHGQGELAQMAEGHAGMFRAEQFIAIHLARWGVCK